MPDRPRTPVHAFGEPYDFEACPEWPWCGCLRACDEAHLARPRRAARRLRLYVLLGCAVPALYAAFFLVSHWSAP